MTRILLIDSNPGERLIQTSRLGDLGFEVHVAETGARGIVEVRASRYEAILLSAELESGASAAEVCRRIKAVPEQDIVPLIVFSRSRTGADAEAMYDAGCQVFMPHEQMGFLDRVLNAQLRAKQREEELRETMRQLDLRCRRLQEDGGRTEESAPALPPVVSARPEGVLLVDGEGRLRNADRGALDLLGRGLVGKHLAEITPNTGLEAFVRDAHSVVRDGFRLEISARRDRRARVLRASVIPAPFGGEDGGAVLRVVLLEDAAQCRDNPMEDAARLELGVLTEAAHSQYNPDLLVGRSVVRADLRRRARELAPSREPILILGDRGAGKSCVARILHFTGESAGPFYQVHCGALGEATLEYQIFGDGPSTAGAKSQNTGPGMLVAARDGTLVLSEIGQLPLRLQGRLLEVLGQGAMLGSGRRTSLVSRIIATSTSSLDGLVIEGRFLGDLAKMLSHHSVVIPALASHIEDLPDLVHAFIRRYGPACGVTGIQERAMRLLMTYDWPANVGELEDCIEQACARALGAEIEVLHLSRSVRALERDLPAVTSAGDGYEAPHTLRPVPSVEHRRPGPSSQRWEITSEDPVSLELYEKKALLRALDQCSGDKLEAARLLNVGKSTLYRKLKRFGIA
jgi:DNA-binding NtrC family response regulator